MDFVEKEALSVPEAVFAAARMLGIDEKEAQVQVLSAPDARRVRVRVGRPGVTLPEGELAAPQASAPASSPAPFSTGPSSRPERDGGRSRNRAPREHSAPSTRVRPSQEQAERLKADLEELLKVMGTPSEVELKERAGNLILNVKGEFESLLIGRRGGTADALQTVMQASLHSATGDEQLYFIVDVADYRGRQEDKLMQLARDLAQKVLAEGGEASTGPLSAAERRLVHVELEAVPGVETFSVGEGSTKKVVIKKKP